jgi:hypothetical protein
MPMVPYIQKKIKRKDSFKRKRKGKGFFLKKIKKEL